MEFEDDHAIPCKDYENFNESSINSFGNDYLDYLGVDYVANAFKYPDIIQSRVYSIISDTKKVGQTNGHYCKRM